MDSLYIDSLLRGKCPECGALFTDDIKRPKMLVCGKHCGYEIDVDSYHEFVEEYMPPTTVEIKDQVEENQSKLNNL